MFRQIKVNLRTVRILAFVLSVSTLGIVLAASISPSPVSALVGTNRAEGGSGKKAASFELLRRPSLRSKFNFTRRVGEVNREICGRDRGCTSKLKKEQSRRGGSCGVATGNATSCDKLSDGRIMSTEKGLGTRGEAGGKAIARQVVKGSLAAVTIGSILLNTKDQVRDPDYVDGDRTYVVNIVGKSKKTNETVNLKNVKVILQVHVERGEKNGCRNNGTGHEGIYSPELSAYTGSQGVASFEHCSHQQITLKLENIPNGYNKVWSQAGGKALEIKSVQDNIPNTTVDNGLITITLEKLEPKKSKQQLCAEEAVKVLGKEQEPTGSYGSTGGNKVTTPSRGKVVIHDIMSKTDALKFDKSTPSDCQEAISHSRKYVVRVYTVNYPGREKGKVTSSFPAEIRFHGAGSCKSPNPHQSGNDSKVAFSGCTRNQIDLELGVPNSYPVVHRVDKNEGYVRVSGFSSKNGATVNINVYLKNELQPFTAAQKAKFAKAATKYWSGVPLNVGPHHISQVPCKPNNVEYTYQEPSYFNRPTIDLAQSPQNGASIGICKVNWNKSAETIYANGNQVRACFTFVHEYGHLLGYYHSPKPNYMMFWSPDFRDPALLRATGCGLP
jgi:hypothetical protein